MRKTLSVYIIAYLVLLVFVVGLQCVYPKQELHLLLNSHHTSFQDTFFKYYSVLAEWPLYVLALLPILWKKMKMTLFFAVSELSGGAVLQILKHIFNFERPASVFEHCRNVMLPVVEGVELHHSNSFPSGHASTFFAFYTCCAFILTFHYIKRAKQGCRREWILFNLTLLVLLILAALGAYSRVYLSQHFLQDVCVGSIIGVAAPCLVYHYGKDKILKLKKTNEIK